MTTILDAYDLPQPEDIRAMGFVIKLRESAPEGLEVRKLVDDYVVTPAVAHELPRILEDMRQICERGEEYGRFIHGSFGSGKSHFMTMLSLILEDIPVIWTKPDPIFAQLREKHQAWIRQNRLLVVRLHMLSVKGKGTGLDRAVYDAFNLALTRRGKQPFEFLHVEGILEEARRESQQYGDIFWLNLSQAGIVGSREEFEAVASGSALARERLARAWLKYKHRDPASAGIDPRWSEGLHRMGQHARDQGFGGLVLMIDEFLLWLAEKSGQEFIKEINDLNVIVDHNTGQRPAPIFAFVARQRDIREFFPDLMDESKIHEHLDHHAKRFEVTRLQDVELRHIVRGRVLRPRLPDAVKKAVEGLASAHEKLLPALLGGGDVSYLKDVYPFHPALIEMLVDVTSLMQRERSALRLLYELLVVHYPSLPLGEFLPVGSAFDAIFPPAGVEASKKVELLHDIHSQYYSRLALAMKQLEDASSDFDVRRRAALEQLVKTVLLAEVSPRLKGAGLTIERLVQLNSVDVEGETFRGRLRVAETDLLALSQLVPDLQVAGTGKTALVRFILGRVSLGEILSRARSKVDNQAQRFKVFWAALKKALEVDKIKGFEDGGPNEGELELIWRKTRRKGTLKLANVRDLPYDDFEPPTGSFRILVDYPWDEPGHTVDDDRARATNVRKNKGNRYTVCWLPRHMSPTELGVITELAAVRYLLTDAGQEDLLETLGPQDRTKVLEQASVRESSLTAQLEELLREVYIKHGELFSLISDLDGSRPFETLRENLERIGTLLMDRRYPMHPHFQAEVKKADLELLLRWMLAAAESNVSVPYEEATGKVLKLLGQPLELVNLGQTKASLRLDSRYIKDVLQRTDQDSVTWSQVIEYLRDTYGFQPLVIDLFLCFLCGRGHRALLIPQGEQIEAVIGMPPSQQLRLQRGQLLETADWHRLRDLGHQLFGLEKPALHRSLQAQDKYAVELRSRAKAKREALQGLYQRLASLGLEKSGRQEEVAMANTRLAPLAKTNADSFKVLSELLAMWPDDDGDPVRSVVHKVESWREALNSLNDGARKHLSGGLQHPTLGQQVRDHLEGLDTLLATVDAQRPLTGSWIQKWNHRAQELIGELIQVPPPPPPPPVLPPIGPGPEVTGGAGTGGLPGTVVKPPAVVKPIQRQTVLLQATLDPSDPNEISSFLGDLRKKLSEVGQARITLSLVREEDEA